MIGKDIKYAADLLRKGEVVAIPTETVYGLGGNALNLEAVAKIFSVKQRPSFDPLIIHLGSFEQIGDYVASIPQPLQQLAETFMPGPLTLLLEKKDRIADLVTAGSPYVAVRIPAHPITQELLKSLNFPVAAPSANPFGYISPTTPQHVEKQLGARIPYILDGGPSAIGLESTIVGLENGRITIFRKGGIAIEAIEQLVGKVEVKAHSSSNPKAPGMLKSHYAPKIKLVIGRLEDQLAKHQKDRIGLINFNHFYQSIPKEHQVQLSLSRNFREAAQHLFAALRYLDELDLDIIVAELLPEQDLGRAINDRLRRAAA